LHKFQLLFLGLLQVNPVMPGKAAKTGQYRRSACAPDAPGYAGRFHWGKMGGKFRVCLQQYAIKSTVFMHGYWSTAALIAMLRETIKPCQIVGPAAQHFFQTAG